MIKYLVLAAGGAALLTLTACGSREAERAAPEAASTEADATSSVSASNPTKTGSTAITETPALQDDQRKQDGSTTPQEG